MRPVRDSRPASVLVRAACARTPQSRLRQCVGGGKTKEGELGWSARVLASPCFTSVGSRGEIHLRVAGNTRKDADAKKVGLPLHPTPCARKGERTERRAYVHADFSTKMRFDEIW